MNKAHLEEIFAHYIEKFEYINNAEHNEIYKWEIAKKFRPMMDSALSRPNEELAAALYEVRKLTVNLIDSYTLPFTGLSKFAEQRPEQVRQMFLDLFAEDSGDLEEKHRKILAFLNQSHALRDELYPDSFLYKDDYHSVTTYLFLYDPDHNYIYKATHAQKFADCVEFYDEWGSGTDIKLDIYYRMCDDLVEAMKGHPALMATDASRFEGKDGAMRSDLFPDENKHILAFDLIYCCSVYNLFQGITFERPNSKARQLIQERKAKAMAALQNLDAAREGHAKLTDSIDRIRALYASGTKIVHKAFGPGEVLENDGVYLTVAFGGAEKKLDLVISVSDRIIRPGGAEQGDDIGPIIEILKKGSAIKSGLKIAENEFSKYAEYLN